jgi:hypothetical protein
LVGDSPFRLRGTVRRKSNMVRVSPLRGQTLSSNMQEIGKLLIVFGIILIGVGLLLTFFNKIPFLGKLPGDILIQRKNLTFYFPLATSILLSIILSLIFWLWPRR